ncbi:Paired amphipathic helix protein Sin3a [Ordospora colligata]|uniref:Putative transcription regulator protein n=1 Tax=Ordospora colligata OC4 TaxID=1354746 RepID=A0A0B2UID5_9MICR|nr:putative transcription regulator protein [Ordospora colligata OC4]KHN68787.1 putative transcription regulator protein [Ordospora colligata OC4]TBU13821.1 putative transcription regulator protein [Ordospora colligata]
MPRSHDKCLSNQNEEHWSDSGIVDGDGEDLDGRKECWRASAREDSHERRSVSGREVEKLLFRKGQQAEVDLNEAISYLNRIREEYCNNMDVYDKFVEVMKDFKFGKIDAQEACMNVREILKAKPHLVVRFNGYLPKYLRNMEDGSCVNASMKHRKRKRLNEGSKQGVEDVMTAVFMSEEAVESDGVYAKYRVDESQNAKAPVMSRFTNVHDAQSGKEVPEEVSSGFRKVEEYEKMKAKQAHEFIQKVKKRYHQNPSIYRSFVELLQSHQVKSGLFDRMKAEVNSLLWESPDLCEDFEKNFVPLKRVGISGEKDVLQRIKDVLKDKNLLDDFLKCINYFNQKFISERDLVALVEPLLRNEELVRGFKEFINYAEVGKEVHKTDRYKMEDGSYKILVDEIKSNRYQEGIAKEVLNFTCISCPKFESEDSNYVFLKRNVHEEALFRIEDEISEADMAIERIQYFVSVLEQVLASNEECEIGIKDIRMSPGVMKEVLKGVYGRSAAEVLEGILMKPQIAIPIVIKRLYMMNKKLRFCVRERRKVWKEVIERNYYKALDAVGSSYKASEKEIFTMKSIVESAGEGACVYIDDYEVLNDVKRLCEAYIQTSQTDNKKTAVEDLLSMLNEVFEKYMHKDFRIVSEFSLFCIYRFVIFAYERIAEVKRMIFEGIISEEIDSKEKEETYMKLMDLCTDFMKKEIDGYSFEEGVREITKCKGFRLYNLKKMISRIEKGIISLVENKYLNPCDLKGTETSSGLYSLRKENDFLEIKMIKHEPGYNWNEYVKRFEHLASCLDSKVEGPFMKRGCRRAPIVGHLEQNLKVILNPETYAMRYVFGSEIFYVNLKSYLRRM